MRARRQPGPSPARTNAPAAPLDRLHPAIVFAALLAVTLAAYWPVLAVPGGLLWDDDGHVTNEAMRSVEGLGRIWFDLGATQQYYPLTHSAFWLQARLWGDELRLYHATSVVLHGCSAFLVTVLLRRLAVPGAVLAGLLFALHPVHVESVAWISELKNTLSGFFVLLAALAWAWFDDTRSRGAWTAAFTLFLLALAGKTVTAMLPGALLIVAWWRHGRVAWRRDVLPLLPFVALGVAAGLLTAWFEHAAIGAQGREFNVTPIERVLIAGRALWFYAASLAWPAGLTFNYPRWDVSQAVWWQYLYPLGAVGAVWLLWRLRARGAFAAVLLFVVLLAPALGFVNVYPFRFSFVADHFQYHASLALLALAAAGLARLTARLPRSAGAVVLVAVLLPLAVLTPRHAADYADAPTLYQTTIARNPGSWLALNNLAALLPADRPDQAERAVSLLREAIRLKPDYAEAHYNLGVRLAARGDFDEAADAYRAAIALLGDDPALPRRLAAIRRRLATSLRALGRTDEAIAEYSLALALVPDEAEGHADLALAFAEAGEREAAIRHFREAVRLAPEAAEHHVNLGTALLHDGQAEQAVAFFVEAIRRDPGFADAHHNLGAALLALGRPAEAVAAFREAVRLNPDDGAARDGLAIALRRAGGR